MQVKIDKFGRVLLPKSIRRQLQLGPGSVLEVEALKSDIELSLVRDEQSLKKMEGLLVYGGRPVGGVSL